MEITVLKCDRCKQEVDGLIEFSFINRNVEPEQSEEDKSSDMHISTLMFGSKPKNYPTVQGGLCLGCVMVISRWLGHPENCLNSSIKGAEL